MQYKDYYAVLGLERTASKDDIKKAYRRLARKYHPDVSEVADAEARFKEVGEAYEVLNDEEKRAAYDQLGADWQAGQSFRPPPDWDVDVDLSRGGFTRDGFSGDGFSGEGFSDFFDSLFGRGFEPREAPADQHVALEVSLEQLYSRTPIEIALDKIELSAEGHPERRQRRLKVTIPRGLGDGQSFRLKGQGNPRTGNRPPGDLFVELRILPHPRLQLDGLDVSSDLTIAPWEAVLGAEVPVTTLGGVVTLKVPAGSKSGTRLRLKDRGLPGGHHYVSLKIDVPDQVDDADRELYEQLKARSSFPER